MCCVLLAGLALDSGAHTCGPSEMTIRVGQTALFSIVAVSGEMNHIDANVTKQPDAGVAGVDTQEQTGVLNAHFGLKGLAPGKTTVTIDWVNPFNPSAFGSCTVTITVVPG